MRTIFPPEQTIDRARTRAGEQDYAWPVNNCEHFAMWCKTGLADSTQIDKMLALFQSAPGAAFNFRRV